MNRGNSRLPKNRPITPFIHPRFIEAERVRFGHTWCMGGLTLLFISTSVLSGLLILLFLPSSMVISPILFRDSVYLRESNPICGFILDVHRISFYLCLVTIFLHGIKVYIKKAYRPPKELNWVIGVLLFCLLFFQAMSGTIIKGWKGEVSSQILDTTATTDTSVTSMVQKRVRHDEDRKVSVKVTRSQGLEARGYEAQENLWSQKVIPIAFFLHISLIPILLLLLTTFHLLRVKRDSGIGL